MDDFSVYGNKFEDALDTLEKIIKRCIESNLSLSNEKCFMMLTEGIVLGHHIPSSGINMDPTKIQLIVNLLEPKNQKDVRNFLRYVGYYRRFINNFSKIAFPLFKLLSKYVHFHWDTNCEVSF